MLRTIKKAKGRPALYEALEPKWLRSLVDGDGDCDDDDDDDDAGR